LPINLVPKTAALPSNWLKSLKNRKKRGKSEVDDKGKAKYLTKDINKNLDELSNFGKNEV
jgi:hypothetical protein